MQQTPSTKGMKLSLRILFERAWENLRQHDAERALLQEKMEW